MAGLVRVKGVAEIVLNVRDIAAMEAFYTRVLGFPRYSAAPDDGPGVVPTIVFLEIAPLAGRLGEKHPRVLALIDPARHGLARGKFDEPDARRSTLNHVAFEIAETDYDDALHALRSAGLAATTMRFPNMGARAIFFKDPEGNTVELICRDPGEATDGLGTRENPVRDGGG